jgi:hypothetical protein
MESKTARHYSVLYRKEVFYTQACHMVSIKPNTTPHHCYSLTRPARPGSRAWVSVISTITPMFHVDDGHKVHASDTTPRCATQEEYKD